MGMINHLSPNNSPIRALRNVCIVLTGIRTSVWYPVKGRRIGGNEARDNMSTVSRR